MTDLRHPIGPFDTAAQAGPARRGEFIAQIAEAPGKMRAAVAGLSAEQLDTPYRPGGWTVRQVVHHLADSSLVWYARSRLALTEDEPVIKPYDEARWAELLDARTGPLEPSLLMIGGLHQRWAGLFQSLGPADWDRKLQHPERGTLSLALILPMIAWHGRHHTAHITELRKRMGWTF